MTCHNAALYDVWAVGSYFANSETLPYRYATSPTTLRTLHGIQGWRMGVRCPMCSLRRLAIEM